VDRKEIPGDQPIEILHPLVVQFGIEDLDQHQHLNNLSKLVRLNVVKHRPTLEEAFLDQLVVLMVNNKK
jgi:hypothetical protein